MHRITFDIDDGLYAAVRRFKRDSGRTMKWMFQMAMHGYLDNLDTEYGIMERWIKLYEKLTEWEWYTDIHTKSLFIHLLLTVNSEDGTWRGTPVKAGTRMANLQMLAGETQMDIKQVRRAVRNLESSGDIVVERESANARHWLVKIANWSRYQSPKTSQTTKKDENGEDFDLPNDLPISVGQTGGQTVDLPNDLPELVGQTGGQTTERKVTKERKEANDIKSLVVEFPERAPAREGDGQRREFSEESVSPAPSPPPVYPSSVAPYPRTSDEVKLAAMMQGIPMTDEEAQGFIDYNAAIGWIMRGEPIRQWKSLLNSWHQNKLLKDRRNRANENGKWDSKYVSKDYGQSEEIV